ncbi:MAG: hypothetical protein MHMPM18_000413 [Marteilia pararefringens]
MVDRTDEASQISSTTPPPPSDQQLQSSPKDVAYSDESLRILDFRQLTSWPAKIVDSKIQGTDDQFERCLIYLFGFKVLTYAPNQNLAPFHKSMLNGSVSYQDKELHKVYSEAMLECTAGLQQLPDFKSLSIVDLKSYLEEKGNFNVEKLDASNPPTQNINSDRSIDSDIDDESQNVDLSLLNSSLENCDSDPDNDAINCKMINNLVEIVMKYSASDDTNCTSYSLCKYLDFLLDNHKALQAAKKNNQLFSKLKTIYESSAKDMNIREKILKINKIHKFLESNYEDQFIVNILMNTNEQKMTKDTKSSISPNDSVEISDVSNYFKDANKISTFIDTPISANQNESENFKESISDGIDVLHSFSNAKFAVIFNILIFRIFHMPIIYKQFIFLFFG